jgi:predicted unusual protein kinase regulating ubiquinone biosynthesis (AarF/ABC1/UbiB family)
VQLLETGFLHADPHPGNLLWTPDGHLCVLDFGLMIEVPSFAGILHNNGHWLSWFSN